MTTKQFSNSVLASKGIVSFNLSDRENKPELETYKSVTFTPAGWQEGDNYIVVSPVASYYDRRAAINSLIRFLFGGDEFVSGAHIYNQRHPERLDGGFGWIDREAISWNNGSLNIHSQAKIGGEWMDVELPHRKFDGIAKVDVKSRWLRATRAMGRLVLSNCPQDIKSGVQSGVLLHDALQLLADNVKVTVTCTFDTLWQFTDENGEQAKSDSIHNKAVYLKRLIDLAEEKGFEAAQIQYFTDLSARNGTFELRLKEAQHVAAVEKLPEAEKLAAKEADAALCVWVMSLDGVVTKLAVNAIPAGRYGAVMVKDAEKGILTDKYVPGAPANLLVTSRNLSGALQIARKGGALVCKQLFA